MPRKEEFTESINSGYQTKGDFINLGAAMLGNDTITDALLSAAQEGLVNHNAKPKNIIVKYVPGSFELPLGAQFLASEKNIDAVICLGCVVQGETAHFDFICDAVANGITNVGLKFNMPVVFGVLTTKNMQQALDRAGGKHGNKGEEAAYTAIKMIGLSNQAK